MAVTLFGGPTPGPTPYAMRALSQFIEEGLYTQAEPQAQALCAAYPRHPFGWSALGAIRLGQRRAADALPALERAATLAPRDASAACQLAHALRDLGRRRDAIAAYQRALRLQPELPGAWFELANLQHDEGQLAQAERSYRRAAAQEPGRAEILSNLSALLHDAGRLDDALAGYDAALAIAPAQAVLHLNRGDVLHDLRRLEDAAAAARRAIALAPGLGAAHGLLGNVLQDLGRFDEAMPSLHRAVELAPLDLDARSSLLFFLNYAEGADAPAALSQARAYGQAAHQAMAGVQPGPPLATASPVRLRVGLVSGDLREHPVGHFLEGLLRCLAGSRLELVALPTQRHEDALTARIRPAFADWVPLAGLSHADAAARVHALGLHLLLDLSGHTAGNRLPLFARRLAPVQASWLGYFATTGVAGMDFLLADPVTLPPVLERDFTETIHRLPHTRLCFTPPREAVPVGPLPALASGGVTFGCFSNLLKLNDGVLALWCRVLQAVPGSSLLLKAKQLGHPEARDAFRQRAAAAGLQVDRLLLEGPEPRAGYLAAYHRVDIGLDPFPFPGGTTTAESLWMGVPVLTMAGGRFIARQGAGLLSAAGLPDWIAPDPDGYVARAVRHAGDLAALASVRAGLRAQILASPLFDAAAFARDWEAALWELWSQRTESL